MYIQFLFGPEFNPTCDPLITLLTPLRAKLFALGAFGVVYDRFFSEVVHRGIDDLT
jgi:hypothetical protein